MHDAEGMTRPLAHAHSPTPSSSSSSSSSNALRRQLEALSPPSQPPIPSQRLQHPIGTPPLPNGSPKYRRHRPSPLPLKSPTNSPLPQSPNALYYSSNAHASPFPNSPKPRMFHATAPPPNRLVAPPLVQSTNQQPALQWIQFSPQHQPPLPPHAMMPPLPPYFQTMVPPQLAYYQYAPFPYSQPLPQNIPSAPGISRTWSTGLIDCFSDIKNCILTFWCPCVTYGQVSEILSEGHIKWWEGSFVYTGLFCFSMLFSLSNRIKMRKKFSLEGDLCSDFFTAMFCQCCLLCQMYRQLSRMGYNVALGWIANKEHERAMQATYQVPPFVDPGMVRS